MRFPTSGEGNPISGEGNPISGEGNPTSGEGNIDNPLEFSIPFETVQRIKFYPSKQNLLELFSNIFC